MKMFKGAVIFIGLTFFLSTVQDFKDTKEPVITEVVDTQEESVDAIDIRNLILSNDHTNEERNRLLMEDVEFLGTWIAENHKNAFHNITEEQFKEDINNLVSQVSESNNTQVFTGMAKILASIGDAHTGMNFWNGYSYPLIFDFFDGDLYVINAADSYEDILYARVVSINGHPIPRVIEQLAQIIPHENEYWLSYMLPQYLNSPVYLEGVGLIDSQEQTVFLFYSEQLGLIEKKIDVIGFGEDVNWVASHNTQSEPFYSFTYFDQHNAAYFKYNVCADMEGLPFEDFNRVMFETIRNRNESMDKFIIDLRHNTGGNSSVIHPFIHDLQDFVAENPEVEVFILTGNSTFSSGVMAVVQIQSVVNATIIGEPTGGELSSYGEVRFVELPNVRIPVNYSINYFELVPNATGAIIPDIIISPSIEDFRNGHDVVLSYIFS